MSECIYVNHLERMLDVEHEHNAYLKKQLEKWEGYCEQWQGIAQDRENQIKEKDERIKELERLERMLNER